MTTFLALYQGQTIGEAKLIAVSVEPRLVEQVVSALLDHQEPVAKDAAVAHFERGRRSALKAILRGIKHD